MPVLQPLAGVSLQDQFRYGLSGPPGYGAPVAQAQRAVQRATRSANAANRARYQQALNTYDQIAGNARAMGKFNTANIQRNLGRGLERDRSSLISRGLYNSTILDSLQRGRETDAALAEIANQESVLRGVNAALRGRAGVIERRTDAGPNLGAYAQYAYGAGTPNPGNVGQYFQQGGGRAGTLPWQSGQQQQQAQTDPVTAWMRTLHDNQLRELVRSGTSVQRRAAAAELAQRDRGNTSAAAAAPTRAGRGATGGGGFFNTIAGWFGGASEPTTSGPPNSRTNPLELRNIRVRSGVEPSYSSSQLRNTGYSNLGTIAQYGTDDERRLARQELERRRLLEMEHGSPAGTGRTISPDTPGTSNLATTQPATTQPSSRFEVMSMDELRDTVRFGTTDEATRALIEMDNRGVPWRDMPQPVREQYATPQQTVPNLFYPDSRQRSSGFGFDTVEQLWETASYGSPIERALAMNELRRRGFSMWDMPGESRAPIWGRESPPTYQTTSPEDRAFLARSQMSRGGGAHVGTPPPPDSVQYLQPGGVYDTVRIDRRNQWSPPTGSIGLLG